MPFFYRRDKRTPFAYFYVAFDFRGRTRVLGSRRAYEVDKEAGRVS